MYNEETKYLPSLEGVVLRAMICTGVHKQRLSLSWRRVSPKNSWGATEEEKSGDKDSDKKSVNKEVTEPYKQVKRTVMHCVHYNALTTHSCFLGVK